MPKGIGYGKKASMKFAAGSKGKKKRGKKGRKK
jgi:hypothetical protein